MLKDKGSAIMHFIKWVGSIAATIATCGLIK